MVNIHQGYLVAKLIEKHLLILLYFFKINILDLSLLNKFYIVIKKQSDYFKRNLKVIAFYLPIYIKILQAYSSYISILEE